jgi:hypothetical protein
MEYYKSLGLKNREVLEAVSELVASQATEKLKPISHLNNSLIAESSSNPLIISSHIKNWRELEYAIAWYQQNLPLVYRWHFSARKIQRLFRKQFEKRLYQLYYQTEEQMELNDIAEFLRVFGETAAADGFDCTPSPTAWNTELSNSSTTFSNGNKSAKRVGE